MKHVISVSIGSSARNKSVEIELSGEKILIERIGTDGSIKKATDILRYYDGRVDALGLGGADLGLMVDQRYYPIYSIRNIAKNIRYTPLTDGVGLKHTFEAQIANFLEDQCSSWLDQQGRRVFLMVSVSRWGMAQSFIEAGYHCTFGDFMFTIGLPMPVYSRKMILFYNRLLCPLITRLPFSWIYPFESEDVVAVPRFTKHYHNANVIAGDCIYLKKRMPKSMVNKILVTNTTTEDDTNYFQKCGVKYLVTTTPVFQGRSFGTNVLEAVITAIAGKGRNLKAEELESWIKILNIKPEIRELN